MDLGCSGGQLLHVLAANDAMAVRVGAGVIPKLASKSVLRCDMRLGPSFFARVARVLSTELKAKATPTGWIEATRSPPRRTSLAWAPPASPTPRTACRVFAASARALPQGLSRLADRADVTVQFVRSSGPGGQNVNKLSTKADVRVQLSGIAWASPEVVQAVQERERNRVNNRGELVVQSDRFRTQQQNVADALQKLNDMFLEAARSLEEPEPDPEKAKRIAALERAAKERRIQEKKKASSKKAERRVQW